MRSQKSLQDDLQFLSEFATLFDVVQQSATSQLRRLEERVRRLPSLSPLIEEECLPLLPRLAKTHPYFCRREGGFLMIVITSDEGMVGPLHTSVIQQAEQKAAGKPVEWVFLGQRGFRLIGQGHAMAMPPEERTEEQLARLRQFILTAYRTRPIAEVWLASPRYLSATHQTVALRQLLPLPQAASESDERQLLIEPSLERTVEALAGVWVQALCREAFWSARLADYAARAMHVEASRQELMRRTKQVRHEFFKALHERMDVLVRETCVVQRQAARRPKALEEVVR